jgi:hypothetical protein
VDVLPIDATPLLGDDELEALQVALVRAGILPHTRLPAYGSEWARLAREEAVESEAAEPSPYALSPRRTRGATRA